MDKNTLCEIMQLSDRILSGKVFIEVLNSGYNALGCTDRRTIYLNLNDISQYANNDLKKFLLLSMGLNFHELAHIEYTTYSLKEIEDVVNKNSISYEQYKKILNCFEDTRIENIFSMKYNKLIDYFYQCCGDIILKDLINNIQKTEEKLSDAKQYYLFSYLSIYGRKFMFLDPKKKEIIEDIRKHIIKVIPNLNEYESLIDDYNTSATDEDRLKIALDVYNKIYNIDIINQIPAYNDIHMLSNTKQNLSKKKESNIKAIIQQIKKIIEDNKNNNTDNKKKTTNNKQDNKNNNKDPRKIKDMKTIKNDVENIFNTNNLKDDTKIELTNNLEIINNTSDEIGFNMTAVHKEEIIKTTNVLKSLRGDLNLKIERYQKKGKFDVRSYIKASNSDNNRMFKNRIDNKIDKSRMGISILLDASGSMKEHQFNTALSSSYILSKSLESLKNKVEILQFSDDYRLIKEFDKKGKYKRMLRDGTNLYDPLNYAVKSLSDLQQKDNINNLFIIIISDGDFSNKEDTFKLLEKIKKDGRIKTLWVFVNDKSNWLYENYKNKFDYAVYLHRFDELSITLQSIIKKIQTDINNTIMMTQ